jgi:hypothetical protein
LQRNRALERGDGFSTASTSMENQSEVVPCFMKVRLRTKGEANQCHRAIGTPRLVKDNSEQMEGLSVVGFSVEYLSIDNFCIAEASTLMELDRSLQRN